MDKEPRPFDDERLHQIESNMFKLTLEQRLSLEVIMRDIARAEEIAYNADHRELLRRHLNLLNQMKEAVKLLEINNSVIRELLKKQN